MDTTQSTAPEFPTAFFGTRNSVKRKVGAQARAWADAYESTGAFTRMPVSSVATGETVFLKEVSDFSWSKPAWRLYSRASLTEQILRRRNYKESDQVAQAFESFTVDSPWGALGAAVDHFFPNTIEVVTARICGVLHHWEALETLRYVDHKTEPVSLSEVMASHFSVTFRMWLPERTANVRDELEASVAAMRRASPAEQMERVVEMLGLLALENRHVKNRTLLSDPTRLRALVSELPPEELEGMATGSFLLLRRLYIFDESISESR